LAAAKPKAEGSIPFLVVLPGAELLGDSGSRFRKLEFYQEEIFQ
jgi:hypothetical protein